MFSKLGLGQVLATSFNKIADGCVDEFPNCQRGATLLIVGDFGGSHNGQHYETYSFLAFDIDRNREWHTAQQQVRRNMLWSRRMSFKALNDKRRRAAIVPFLEAANHIRGWLVTFAISRSGGSLFSGDRSVPLMSDWKAGVRERVVRVVHLSSYLLAGLSNPAQDVYWFIDEDEVAANARQLTQLTGLVANLSSHFLTFNLRHIKCGTTKSDNGGFMFEDACAICDLAAGAIADVFSIMIRENCPISGTLISPLPRRLSSKTSLILSWLAM